MKLVNHQRCSKNQIAVVLAIAVMEIIQFLDRYFHYPGSDFLAYSYSTTQSLGLNHLGGIHIDYIGDIISI
jgi:hypothetical protein